MRAAGTQAGGYLILEQGWQATMPGGTAWISARDNSLLVLGWILVYSNIDLTTAALRKADPDHTAVTVVKLIL